MMHRGFFITGTDTGVGKTIIAAAIIKTLRVHGLSVCAMKPVETGCPRSGDTLFPSDGMFLKRVAGMDEPIRYVTPYCFETPAAPLVSAELENKPIHRDAIIDRFSTLTQRYEAVVVEGLGGLLVPITSDYSVIDLIKELCLPVIVVSRPSLGTLNHTLLTVNYALRERVSVAGVIVNFSRQADGTISEETNPRMIRRLSPVPFIGTFPHLPALDDDTIEKAALAHLNGQMLLAAMQQ